MPNGMQLVIVRRGQLATFGLLSQAFADEPNVRLIWDRRVRDRRQDSGAAVAGERRRGDRRRSTPVSWEQHDYLLLGVTRDETIASAREAAPGGIVRMTKDDVARDIETAIALDLNILITGGDPVSRSS